MGSPCILLTPGQGGTLPSTRSSVTPAAPGDPSSTEELTGGAGSAPHCEKRDSSFHRPRQPDVLADPARHRCTHTWLAPCSRWGSTLSVAGEGVGTSGCRSLRPAPGGPPPSSDGLWWLAAKAGRVPAHLPSPSGHCLPVTWLRLWRK